MSFCKICDPKCKFSDCICNKKFDEFYETYEDIRKQDIYENFNLVKQWDISTMTVCCCFNDRIDLSKYISEYLTEPPSKKFYNCINIYLSVKYQKRIRISCKIFSNGNIQLAGVLNACAVCYAVRKIFLRLKKTEAFQNKSGFISNIRICMINSDFKIDKNIKQAKLCKILESGDIDFVKTYSFNPNKYPGINVKIQVPESEKIITCSIFRPGSIILTGGNDISIYKSVYDKVLNLLNTELDILY